MFIQVVDRTAFIAASTEALLSGTREPDMDSIFLDAIR